MFFEDIWRVTNLIDGTFDGICLIIVKFIYKNQIVKDGFRAVPSRSISFPANSQIEIDPQNRSPPLDQTDQQTTLF